MNKITGFKVVSIIYFILMLVLGIACVFLGNAIKMPAGMARAYSILFIVIAVLYLIALIIINNKNKSGKLAKTAFIFPIVLGFVSSSFLAIPYIVVSIVTMNKLQENNNANTETVDHLANDSLNQGNNLEQVEDAFDENNESFTKGEFVSDESQKTNKTNMITFWIVTIIYGVTLILSIISLFGVNILWNNSEMNKVTAGWLIAFFASYGLYFFLLSPFRFSKKIKIIGSISSIGLMILLDILPIILLINNKETLTSIDEGVMFGWFSSFALLLISIIVSEVGIVLLYLLSLIRLNPEKIKNKKQVDSGYKEKEPFYVFVLKLLIGLIIAVFNSSLALMRLKEKHINIYSILIILLCSYLCCVLSEILMILLAIFVVGFVIMVMAKMYDMGSFLNERKEIKVKLENGKVITLSQTVASGNIWYDKYNHRWEEEGLGKFTYID